MEFLQKNLSAIRSNKTNDFGSILWDASTRTMNIYSYVWFLSFCCK